MRINRILLRYIIKCGCHRTKNLQGKKKVNWQTNWYWTLTCRQVWQKNRFCTMKCSLLSHDCLVTSELGSAEKKHCKKEFAMRKQQTCKDPWCPLSSRGLNIGSSSWGYAVCRGCSQGMRSLDSALLGPFHRINQRCHHWRKALKSWGHVFEIK